MKGKKSSKYHGVSWRKASLCWVGRITIKGEAINVGSFKDEKECAKMVDRCLIRHFKEPKNFTWTKKIR